MKLFRPLGKISVKFTTIFKPNFWTPKRRYITGMIVLILVLAPLFTFYLQYRSSICNFNDAWQFFVSKPGIFWYSSLIMLLLGLVLTCILGNVLVAQAVLFSVILGLSFAHINKFVWRASPLLPEDFTMASEGKSLTSFINPWDLTVCIISIILVITVAIITSHILRKERPKFNKKRVWVARLIGLIVSVVLLSVITLPVRQPKTDRRDFVPFLDSQLVAWNQTENYQQNGFIVGFISNIQMHRMAEPAGYNQQAITKIVQKYQAIAKQQNASRTDVKTSDINFIFIQNESFIDPSRLAKYYPYTGGDVTPQLHKLQQENTASGWHYSSDYGGGTANMEFEALTGFSNYFIGMVPFTQIVSKEPGFPSFASFLDNQNYETTGMHPYIGSMYKRNIVYPNLGFNKFMDETNFKYTAPDGNGEYISDASAYKQMLAQLNSTKKSQFITLITMQNHMPYGTHYDHYDFKSVANKGNDSNITDYLQMLHASDTALGNLVQTLNKSDKKVVLVLWGDHLAGLYNDLPASMNDAQHETPLLMWANFAVPSAKQDLGALSANYFATTTLDYVNAKKSGFNYLLDAVKAQDPTLTKTYFNTKAPKDTTALTDYKLIEYDVVSGKKYAEKLNFFD
ncbi:LTA synthase family protein [Candidatus Saccharibacteria bacterium]|nr:LTA synthase family protein [Candidatus Saccharibacteria bacterium]